MNTVKCSVGVFFPGCESEHEQSAIISGLHIDWTLAGDDGPEEAGQSQWILGSAVRDPHSHPHGSSGRRV